MVGCLLGVEVTADVDRVSSLCDKWSLEDLADMSEEDMQRLLECFKKDEVPTLQQVRFGDSGEGPPFDGSFGWWI